MCELFPVESSEMGDEKIVKELGFVNRERNVITTELSVKVYNAPKTTFASPRSQRAAADSTCTIF